MNDNQKDPEDDGSSYSTDIGKTSPATPSPSLPLIYPFIINQGFELKDQIGSGQFSKVYRATWTQMPDIDIACKRIEIQKVDQEWRNKCLNEEMSIMLKLKHPNIVNVYKVFKTRNLVFIFMEMASNGTIKEQMVKARHPFKEIHAKTYFKQIMDGLSYMHSKYIAHRDLKLENFLLNGQWIALISDFGFACLSSDLTHDKILRGTQCGSAVYMAPEVHNASPDNIYDAKVADIYSMGVCLFEFLNYDKPFNEELAETNSAKLIQFKLNRNYRFHSKIESILSNDIKDLVHRLLEPNPEKRINSEQIFRHSALQ